jgi:hypothetical protein
MNNQFGKIVMKKHVFTDCLAATISLVAGADSADTINGRLGVTAKIGFLIPADNESGFYDNSTDTGIVGGGGLIYGLNDHFALNLIHWYGDAAQLGHYYRLNCDDTPNRITIKKGKKESMVYE